MNTMTELLLTDLHETRIADRLAAADARRLAASGTTEPLSKRTWSVGAVLRLLTFSRRSTHPLEAR